MPKQPFDRVTRQHELRGRYVLLRLSVNVPIKEGVVTNQFRILRSLPTLQFLVRQGARVIACGHIGRDGSESIQPVADIFAQYVPVAVSPEVSGTVSKNMRDELQDGEVLFLENLRKDPREKKNDSNFARELADFADIYVNDAFAASHRPHASLVGVPKFLPSYVGMNFVHEYEELLKARKPEHPALFMLGGSKFETKMPLIEKFLDVYDHVFVGGALANDLLKAKGYEVGKSLVSDIDLSDSSLLQHPALVLPIDVTVASKGESRVCAVDDVKSNEMIMDVGPKTVALLAGLMNRAKMVLWNGPFGNYEQGFDAQTVSTAKILAGAPGYSIVGGGDTVASIEALCCQEHYSFLSTAGGAMLTFLEEGTLPAIEALQDAPQKKAGS